MPTIAELLGQAAAERLAAARLEAGQREERAASVPVRPATCQSCGQPLPVPQAVFRSGAERQADPLADSGRRPQDAYARA